MPADNNQKWFNKQGKHSDDHNFRIQAQEQPQEDGRNEMSQSYGKWLRITL